MVLFSLFLVEGKIIADCFVATMHPGIGNKNAQQLQLARRKLIEKKRLARRTRNRVVMLNPKFLPPRRVDVEDGDPDCDHPTGDSRASGNEDSGSDPDSDSEEEMSDAGNLDLEEAVFDKNAFEMLLMGSQQPEVLRKRPFSISVTWTFFAHSSAKGEGSKGTAKCSRGGQGGIHLLSKPRCYGWGHLVTTDSRHLS